MVEFDDVCLKHTAPIRSSCGVSLFTQKKTEQAGREEPKKER